MIQYFGNNVFQEDHLQACKVAPDGSFSLEIPLEYPILSYLWSDNSSSPLYFFLTPDGETTIQIDSAGLVHYPAGSRCGKLASWLSNAAPSFNSPLDSTILMLADYAGERLGFSKEEAHLLKQKIRIMAAARELLSVSETDPSLYISMAKLDPEDWTAFSISNEIFSLSNYYQFLGPMRGISNDTRKMMAVDSAVFKKPGPSIFLQAAIMNGRGL
ncbi:MAG: hypothetical protein J5907_05545, partial [Bacteroidales bacterium]|nr:hypothetical protein [Bacteroidales bacterium]